MGVLDRALDINADVPKYCQALDIPLNDWMLYRRFMHQATGGRQIVTHNSVLHALQTTPSGVMHMSVSA